jgi:dTMP kinase
MTQREQGIFIGIEGGDGSGKGTQAELTEMRARAEGLDVLRVSFPRYGMMSAAIVGRYLDGQYGAGNDIHPDLASLPYALDRFAAAPEIFAHLAKGPDAIVITDRYDGSNKAHQGTKLADAAMRHAFYAESDEIEYGILRIPKPDLNIVLLVPPKTSQSNVDKKAARSYTDKVRDIHEADANHLELAKANYEELCQLFPERYTPIDCMVDEDRMRTKEDIQSEIWARVSRLLAA